MKNLDSIIKFLSSLGLAFDQSKIYISLLENPGVTILQLSRNSKISRTNVYRIVDELRVLGLLDEVKRDGKKYLYPVGAHKLELVVKEQEAKVDLMRKVLPEITALITSSDSIVNGATKVQLYKGVDGVSEMLWNSLRSDSEILCFTFKDYPEIVGEEFNKKWESEVIKRNLRIRQLVSDSFLVSSIKDRRLNAQDLKNFRTRYFTKSILDITHQITIYNNIVGFYLVNEKEVFGIEVHSYRVSNLQKQLFDLAWEKGSE